MMPSWCSKIFTAEWKKEKHRCIAAREGASEIGLAVMATTFSIVAVFVPVAFMKGIVWKILF